jgi:O-antigen/teichoic acid export membrane protein
MASQGTGRQRSALAHMLLLVGGTGASQVLMALSAPFLTRIYTPHDFGVYAVALAVFNLMVAVVCLRYEMAIVLPKTLRSAANVAVLCLAVALVVTFVATIICLVFWLAPVLGHWEGLEWWAALLIPWGVLSYGLQQILRMWFIRHSEFSVITRMVMAQTLVTIAVQVLAGYFLSSRPVYLMLGTVLGYVATVLVALPRALAIFPTSLLSGIRVSRLLLVARRHRHFPIFSSPYNFLAQAVGRLLLLILALFVPTSVIGEFALAQRVVYLPISVLTSSMGQVFYSRAAQSLNDPRLQLFVLRIMVAGILVFMPLVAFNFVFAEDIFRLAFGARWAESGRFAAYLGVAAGFITVTAWLDRVYDIRSRQHLSLLLEAVADGISLLVLGAVMYITRDAVAGVAGYSISVVGYYFVWTYVTFRIAPFPRGFYGRLLLVIGIAAVAVTTIGFAASVVQSHLLQACLFGVSSLPMLLLGLHIGRNGLGQRPTRLGPIVL